jgi:hypothetical protein
MRASRRQTIGLLVAGFAVPLPAAPPVAPVADRAALLGAIAGAEPGSIIRLAPGDYGNISIDRAMTQGAVRITGPRTARISQLQFLPGADNWLVSGITLAGAPSRGAALTITAARRIGISDVEFVGHGNDPGVRNEEAYGLAIRNAEAVVISGSRFHQLRLTAILDSSRGVIFSGNVVESVREGLNFSNCHGVAIRHNLMRRFRPRYDTGEHADFIQFWTRNRPSGSSRVEVSGNYLAGGGEQPAQGLFVRAEDFERGTAPEGYHRDFAVRQNIYHGSARSGISLSDVRGAVVEQNSVLASPNAFVGIKGPKDPTGETAGGLVPAIVLRNGTSGSVRGNVTALLIIAKESAVSEAGTLVYKPRQPGDAGNPGGLLRQPLDAGDLPLERFARASGRKQPGADPALVGPSAARRDMAALMTDAAALAEATAGEPAGVKMQPSRMERLRQRLGIG